MITTSPVDPILRIPNQKVDDAKLIERGILKYHQFSLDRIEWMRRRERYYLGWDDYISPVRKGLWSGSSNLHLPITEEKCAVMHALIMQSMFFNFPWFYLDPQEDVDVHRLQKAERFMKYILERYCNFNKGIYAAMDDWAWDLVTEGIGILSRSWKKQERRFVTIEKNRAFQDQRLDLQKMLEDTDEKEFDRLAKAFIRQPFAEKAVVRTIFDGPLVVAEDPKYVLFKGEVVDATDLNEQETVIKVCYFNRNDLVALMQSGYFREQETKDILDSQPDIRFDRETAFGVTRVRRQQDIQTGVNTLDPHAKEDRWEFLCVYDSTSLNGSDNYRMPDRIQYFIHERTRKLMRWTYLDRISSSGNLPLHMAHLFRRPRRSTGRGMVETMYGLNDASDILVNQAIDAGMLANQPMFAYAGGSTFDPDEMRIEPGLGVKVDNPQTDLRFFTWNVNPNWSMPIMGMIGTHADLLTSIGPNQSGQVGANVGPLRSAQGVKSLNQMGSTQQNVLIKRAANCVSSLFEGLFSDCTEMMSHGLRITVTGPDGVPLLGDNNLPISEEITPQELKMKVHFGIYANAGNIDRDQRKQDAATIAQFSFQALPIQTGVIRPENVFNILENMHQSMGTMNVERFISKPKDFAPETLEWEMRKIMQGIMPIIVPGDPEHEAKIEAMSALLDSDTAQLEASQGIVAKNAMEILKKVIAEHQKFAQMMQKPSTVQNPFGDNQSPTLGQGQAVEGNAPPPQEVPQENFPPLRQGGPDGGAPAGGGQ